MRVYLLRHGKTAGNLDARYVGSTDEPLYEAGILALSGLQAFPAALRVYTSPLLRARQTASLLFPDAEQRVVAGLREMDFGCFEGKTALELQNDAGYRLWVDGGCVNPCPEGEGLEGFSARVCEAFHTVIDEATSREEDTVIIVTHGGSIMAIMDRYAGTGDPYYHWHVKNGCGYRVALDERTWASRQAFLSYEPVGEAEVF